MSEPPFAVAGLVLTLPDEAATVRFATRMAGLARRGDVIGLGGALGMGKTSFARAFIRALTTPEEEVPSPTFTLVQSYDSRIGQIFHFDLYRLERPEDAWELGIEEAFTEGISLIEWPERLGALRPSRTLDLRLAPAPETGENARALSLSGGYDWHERLGELVGDV